jgi:hypothetical protein
MSEVAVLVVFFSVVSPASPTDIWDLRHVGQTALTFPNKDACLEWRGKVNTQALRDMFNRQDKTETVMSVCLPLVEAPPLVPCPQERTC